MLLPLFIIPCIHIPNLNPTERRAYHVSDAVPRFQENAMFLLSDLYCVFINTLSVTETEEGICHVLQFQDMWEITWFAQAGVLKSFNNC